MQTLVAFLLAPFFSIGWLFAPHIPQQAPIPAPAASADYYGSPYDIYHVADTEQFQIEQAQANGVLGASNLIETPVALFHTSLANAISATANSMTLVSAITMDGTSLASSTYSFVLDSGTPTQEFVIADCTGTVCTNMQRGLSVVTGTTTITSLEQAHRRTATVDIVDAPLLLKVASLLNGLTAFSNALSYTSGVTNGILALNGLNLASVNYVNYVGSSGCANAAAGTRGCVDIATALQTASSTAIGSSGALLVIPASLATSSPGATFTLGIPSTQNDGKLSALFLNGSLELYTFNNLFTAASGMLSTASSTFSATTSIAATASNKLILNGVSYVAPASQGAANTVYTNDGSGNLSWAVPKTLLVVSTTQNLTTSNSTTSLATYVLPAGKLTTAGVLKINYILTSDRSSSGSCSSDITFGNGTATSTIGYAVNDNTIAYETNAIDTTVYATSTTAEVSESLGVTSPQNQNSTAYAGTNGANTVGPYFASIDAAMAYNLNAQLYISLDARMASNTSHCILQAYSVQLLN